MNKFIGELANYLGNEQLQSSPRISVILKGRAIYVLLVIMVMYKHEVTHKDTPFTKDVSPEMISHLHSKDLASAFT